MSSAAAATTTTSRYQDPYDPYYAKQIADISSSPPSNRTQLGYPSKNAFASNQLPSQQQQYYSSANADFASSLSAQSQPLSSMTNSTLLSNTGSAPRLPTQGPPVNPPPRSSSQHAKSMTTTSDIGSSPAANNSNLGNVGSEDVAATSTRSRGQHNSRNAQAQPFDSKGSTSRRTNSQRQTDPAPIPPPMSREDSAIINRVVTSDPSEDIEREQARIAESQPHAVGADNLSGSGLALVGSSGVKDGSRSTSKRQDFSRSDKTRKEMKFGDYILGQTLGEGEFGKVKMGWKKEGGVQVAIKLIRREKLGDNPGRLPKIYREIAILRELDHPNIVRLHEMVETERNIGIILEYASGGELFDYILHQRFLKDHAARRLFAQLVSGVGYLHKKGIVHRDLKLENLLLDRNRNIIITDFGFANMFNPDDELPNDIEMNLADKEFVKKAGLDNLEPTGFRRGDLMQTSCGSPCYAAPELVVSDSLYTGRKVDVWSCGVILYAMLAGYLPFDDDPDNPEGDNINLLYKYIVSTPLTFPEYITPHARDLLRRMLVADPRKRADLFEVARHSWLTEYEHVVSFITSSATTSKDIGKLSQNDDSQYGVPSLARSASVREPKPSQHAYSSSVTPVTRGTVDGVERTQTKTSREAKRRTVQLEYVPPQTQTTRGETGAERSPTEAISAPTQRSAPRTRVRKEGQGPVPVDSGPAPPPKDYYSSSSPQQGQSSMPAPQKVPRSTSDSAAFSSVQPGSAGPTRPSTGGSMGPSSRLPSRGSYGQPAAATVATTNAQGRFAQPTGLGAKQYVISGPLQQQDQIMGDPQIIRPPYIQTNSQSSTQSQRHHKRSNTLGGLGERLFGRSSSVSRRTTAQRPERPEKSYPPTSMKDPIETDAVPRKSVESRRSFGFGRKASSDMPPKERRSSRRFSFIPQGMSLKNITGGGSKDQYIGEQPAMAPSRRPHKPSSSMAFGRGLTNSPSASTMGSNIPALYDGSKDQRQGSPGQQPPRSAPIARQQPSHSAPNFYDAQSTFATSTPPPPDNFYQMQQPPPVSVAPPSNQAYNFQDPNPRSESLQRDNRKFADAYEQDTQHGGSSGAARKVMDFFRRRGRARGGDDR